MRAVVIKMAHIPVNNNSGVSLVVDQQPVGALGADAAYEPFGVAVRPGRARRDLDHGDAFGGEDGIKGSSEFAVPVTDQKAEGADAVTEVHQQVASGLSSPDRRGVSAHAEKMDPASADLHHKQNIKAAQPDGVEGEKVGSQQPGRLSTQEGSPPGVCSTWCRAEPSDGQDPPNSAGAHPVLESGKFTLDPAMAP